MMITQIVKDCLLLLMMITQIVKIAIDDDNSNSKELLLLMMITQIVKDCYC